MCWSVKMFRDVLMVFIPDWPYFDACMRLLLSSWNVTLKQELYIEHIWIFIRPVAIIRQPVGVHDNAAQIIPFCRPNLAYIERPFIANNLNSEFLTMPHSSNYQISILYDFAITSLVVRCLFLWKDLSCNASDANYI